MSVYEFMIVFVDKIRYHSDMICSIFSNLLSFDIRLCCFLCALVGREVTIRAISVQGRTSNINFEVVDDDIEPPLQSFSYIYCFGGL
jgi:hypothetical protein